MKKKKLKKRLALFVRIKRANKEFIQKETERALRTSDKFVTTQDTVDTVIAGYRKIKKDHPRLAAKYF